MTTSSIDLSPLPFFDPYSDPSSIGPRWKLWKRRFETYIGALGISDPTRKRALLLYQSGPATQDIFDTLPDTGDAANYTLAMQKLDTLAMQKLDTLAMQKLDVAQTCLHL